MKYKIITLAPKSLDEMNINNKYLIMYNQEKFYNKNTIKFCGAENLQ